MTREELQHDFHNERGIGWLNSQGEPDIDYVMWLEDKILAIKNNAPLPPAEGASPSSATAEEIRQLLLGWEHYKRDHFRESDALDVEAILMSEYSQFAAFQNKPQPTLDPMKVQWSGYGELGNISQKPLQPQPTAEGAEEFLKNRGWDDIENDMIPASIVVKQLQEYAAQQQPTAEGAEEIRVEYSEESLGFFRSFIKARKELCAKSPTETYSLEEAIRKAFDGFFPKPLSVIDDAETILHSHPYLKVWMENVGDSEMKVCNIEQAIWAIEKAATLHAQKLADKMVSDRDDDVFDKMNCLVGYLERWWKNPQSYPPVELKSVINEAIEYLKSREK
jgi:hypothetical protein